MLYFLFLTLITGVLCDDLIYYETLTGRTLSLEEYKQYIKLNITFWCSGSYKPCDASEGRRLDTTCNNLKFPYRGPPHTPSYHELPLRFDEDNNPVKTMCGDDPEPVRRQRTATLIEGTIPDDTFTALAVHFMLFMVNGVTSIHDTVNYVRWVPYCCQEKGKTDSRCAPMTVPADDYVHQFSDIRCMNMTKPFTYQSVGCIRDKKMKPERINSASNFLDLSIMYGFDNSYRTMHDGLLQYEVENGKIWPVSTNPKLYCLLNQGPEETRCHKNVPINGLVGTNFLSVIFWRLHNYIAMELKKINPCWDDDKLFHTARDINTAVVSQMYYYELMPDFMGRMNLLRDGVISPNPGFRKTYNKYMPPQVSQEYIYVLRWGHTIQPGMIKLYDCDGNYEKQIPSVNLTLRTGYYACGKHMEGITQGCFRQPMGKIDHVVEPSMAETGLSYLQRAFDILAADLTKGGLLGIGSYVQYRRLCTGKKYTCFDDLADDIEPSYLEILKGLYKHPEDIPLMVGVWVEKKIPGGFAPRTLYCLKARQLRRFIQYDRHWYESPTRPNAFTACQLGEIRKATMAWVFCTVGDSVKEIQPRAFLLERPGNEIDSCDYIPSVDLSAWKDDSCSSPSPSCCGDK